jgi:anti-sigma B factor antagonist
MAANPRISQSDADGVTVIRFLDRNLFDETTIREVGAQLFAAMPVGGPPRLILDFSGVQQVSSALLGKLILLQRRVDAAGGKLRLCELGPAIRDVMRTTNLDRLFAIDRDLRESREALAAAGRS